MILRCFLFALQALLGLCAPVGAAQEAPSLRLRVASYNLGNYNACDRMTREGYRQDYPKEEVQKKALRSVIRKLNADLLALQEMGSPEHLAELQRDLRKEGLDYTHAELLNDADDTERKLAILSRLPLSSVRKHKRLEFKFREAQERVKRGLLEAVVSCPQGELTLWIVHLKSRFTEDEDDPNSAGRRAAEAVAIRDLILQRHRDPSKALFMIAGDFNDTKLNRPLRAIMDRGKTPISELLEACDSRGERWTYHNAKDDSYDRIDHLLISPGLLQALGRRPQARILDVADAEAASDHRPVYVDLPLEGPAGKTAGR